MGKYQTVQTLRTDILIVGTGFAGLKAAFTCVREGIRVVLVSEKRYGSGSSFYPLTCGIGCQAPLDAADQEALLREINESSAGMNDEALSRVLVEEVRDRILELPQMGIPYRPLTGRTACFAKTRRILYLWTDWDAIRKETARRLHESGLVTVLEHTALLKLDRSGGRVTGGLLEQQAGGLVRVEAGATILASGGYCGLYRHSLNTPDVTGEAHIAALHAGASLMNLEFLQFIPGMISPLYKCLFSEQTLAFCKKVTDAAGNEVFTKHLPDSVTARECFDSRFGHGPFTSADISRYFDIAMIREYWRTGDPACFGLVYDESVYHQHNDALQVHLDFLESHHIDLLHDRVSILPFAHAANGGIRIGRDAGAGPAGLFAAGEAAGGMHGADRHGGNASASCLVFGHRAACSAVRFVKENPPERAAGETAGELEALLASGAREHAYPAAQIMQKTADILYENCNVVRTGERLDRARRELAELRDRFSPAAAVEAGESCALAVKAKSALELADILCTVMGMRRESRGAHYREDYPQRDDAGFQKKIVVSEEDGNPVCRFEP